MPNTYTKVCAVCGKTFTAHQSRTQCCSDACSKKLYKFNKKKILAERTQQDILEKKRVFKSTPTQFQTIIYATADIQNVGDYDGDVSETKLTERQQEILNLIKESPTITGKQMSETLSVSQRTIERDLSTMQRLGFLKHEGKDNYGAWIVTADNYKVNNDK